MFYNCILCYRFLSYTPQGLQWWRIWLRKRRCNCQNCRETLAYMTVIKWSSFIKTYYTSMWIQLVDIYSEYTEKLRFNNVWKIILSQLVSWMHNFSFDGRAFKKGVTNNAVSLKAESVERAHHTSDTYLKFVLKN